jgi:galactoside O-acetyltransferase
MTRTLPPYCTAEELTQLGFHSFGSNVRIDRTCRFYGAEHICIGSNVRIDAYSVLSASEAGLRIGDYIHISVGVTITGGGAVTLEDFCGLSARVALFSSNDDYAGGAMTGPLVPEAFRHVKTAPILIRRHAVVGSGSIILPGVAIGVGAAVGALSLVKRDVADFAIVSGNPLRQIGERARTFLEYEERMRKQAGCV